jgi:hypothetical protein
VGPEVTAGLPASLTAIGLYTGIISAIGLGCCCLVSIYERRLQSDAAATAESARARPALSNSTLRQVEAKGLRNDFLSRN